MSRRMFESPLHDCEVYHNERIWALKQRGGSIAYHTRFAIYGPRTGWPMTEVWKDHRLATRAFWGVWDLQRDDKVNDGLTWFEARDLADQMDRAWLTHMEASQQA